MNFHITKIAIFFILTLWITVVQCIADDISGQIVDAISNEILAGTVVRIRKLGKVVISDENGHFNFNEIPPGTHLVEFLKNGYPRFIQLVATPLEQSSKLIVRIAPATGIGDVFYIGAIEIVKTNATMPVDYSATTRITAAEIEHLQATNLGDVLEMVPGVEKNNRVGLDRLILANIRGMQNDRFNTFGTRVVVDHAPFSNNANMMFADPAGSANSGLGIDLRLIPADNIESVEIIRGVPPARYGDLTGGIINVITKHGIARPRLKLKQNPNTHEANFYAGFAIKNLMVNSNANYGFSERERRRHGDEYHRLTGSINMQFPGNKKRMKMNWKVFASAILDENESPIGANQEQACDHGYRLHQNWWGQVKLPSQSWLKWSAYWHHTKIDKYRSHWVAGDSAGYTGEQLMKGNEITYGGRFEWQHKHITTKTVHDMSVGVQVQSDGVRGDGMTLDSTFNYFGDHAVARSYSFDDIPDITQLAFYTEDQWTTAVFTDVTWILGLRYDMFGPSHINYAALKNAASFIESRHGTFLSPRIGWMAFITPSLQFRGGYGVSAKSPSLFYLYRSPEVHYYAGNHKRICPHNDNLKGYAVSELKMGIDYRWLTFASFSIEGYYSRRRNAFRKRLYPVWQSDEFIFDMPTYSIWENIDWSSQRGVELFCKTNSWNGLFFSVSGHYRHTKWGATEPQFEKTPIPNYIDPEGNAVRDPYWQFIPEQWNKKWLFDYRIDWRCKPMALWIQVFIHHEPLEQLWDTDSAASGNFWAGKTKNYPSTWFMNVRISKQLWPGTEVSLYMNNIYDNYGIYEAKWDIDIHPLTNEVLNRYYRVRQTGIFWGIEWSSEL